ncbi:polyprenyl synthetase family protein [Arthrobacter sp. APC 3897]|uniref:polyprenyl synthetase family protein n=1 Tax=Arthrobacter sp. APC 3897 TaxID=3035204 RepID=UPI0025B57A11|nr:polyprenyl synthetase family protein [Arthrobacter sp. APC 3897]MDN3481926.1 polyprenyl synthetase family protein [Arthrobacter sp. APC 3897]
MTESSNTSPDTAADDALTALPAGFALIAEDPQLGPSIAASLELVETRLLEAISNADPFANATSRHLAQAGGKRIRPLLTLLASHLGPEPTNDKVIQAAVVVELTHLATLYHDDVMDSAPLRRGAPTAHEVWGNSVAVLTGDLIFARASSLVSELGGEALGIQAHTFERLCMGQLHETVGPREDQDPLEHYLAVISGKTASLIAASGQFGSLFSGAERQFINVMVEYGEKVGTAFQLADDVIDVTGREVKSGKTPGTDLREGVPTLPVLILRRNAAAGDAEAAAVLELVDGDLSSDEALAAAVEALRKNRATAEAWAVARQWSDEAVAALEPLPDTVVKQALASFAVAVVERDV